MKLMNIILALMLTLFSAVTLAQTINVNTASASELQSLKGIGPTKASAIIQYREENGPFKSLDDLTRVPGIKDKALEKLLADNKGMLTVEEEKAEVAETPESSSAPSMPKTAEIPSAPKMPEMPKTPEMPKAPVELPKQ
jgi:competence protein ComEA